MLALVYTNIIATYVFIAACLIWLIPEIIGMFRQMSKVSRKTAVTQDRGSMIVLIGLQWIGLALNFLLAWLFPVAALRFHRTLLFIFGILFIVLGVALRWFAIWTLGRYFTRDVAVSRDQEVIQTGPYRFVRHPSYSGTFLTMLGVGLAMTNWASLSCLLLCVFLGHFYRIKIEEEALIQSIGQPYVEYMHRTKRFVPLLF